MWSLSASASCMRSLIGVDPQGRRKLEELQITRLFNYCFMSSFGSKCFLYGYFGAFASYLWVLGASGYYISRAFHHKAPQRARAPPLPGDLPVPPVDARLKDGEGWRLPDSQPLCQGYGLLEKEGEREMYVYIYISNIHIHVCAYIYI